MSLVIFLIYVDQESEGHFSWWGQRGSLWSDLNPKQVPLVKNQLSLEQNKPFSNKDKSFHVCRQGLSFFFVDFMVITSLFRDLQLCGGQAFKITTEPFQEERSDGLVSEPIDKSTETPG